MSKKKNFNKRNNKIKNGNKSNFNFNKNVIKN